MLWVTIFASDSLALIHDQEAFLAQFPDYRTYRENSRDFASLLGKNYQKFLHGSKMFSFHMKNNEHVVSVEIGYFLEDQLESITDSVGGNDPRKIEEQRAVQDISTTQVNILSRIFRAAIDEVGKGLGKVAIDLVKGLIKTSINDVIQYLSLVPEFRWVKLAWDYFKVLVSK